MTYGLIALSIQIGFAALATPKAHNPQQRTQDGHLLYARTLEALGNADGALDRDYAGAQAKCRHGELLRRLGRAAEARLLFEEIPQAAVRTSKHGRALNREWIATAKEALAASHN